MWKNSMKNVESDNNKILYETLFDFFLQRNGTYFLNKPRIMLFSRFTLRNLHWQRADSEAVMTNFKKYVIKSCRMYNCNIKLFETLFTIFPGP